MEAEWNAPRLPLETFGIGPYHSGAVKNTSDIPTFCTQGNSARNMSFPGYSGNINNSNSLVATISDSPSSRHIVRDSGGSLLVDSMHGLSGIHTSNSGVAVEWSPTEQQLLQDGLVKFADEPSIMKYIKIAASLCEKTVRDVALRCKWIMGKRKKQDESHARKATFRKNKLAESQSQCNPPPTLHDNAGYSFPTPQLEQRDPAGGELTIMATQLLDQNHRVLEQIDANLSAMQPQKNVTLISCSSKYFEELSAILRQMSGGISQLPELPAWDGQEDSSVDILHARCFGPTA